MSTMMRAVDIRNGKGPAEALFIANVPKPDVTGAQALVRVKAFGLNRMDLLQREGMYPVPPQAPATLGVEFSGVIESLGQDAEKSFDVGEEVFGLAYGGAYAEYIAVSTHMLIKKPPQLSWEQCAGIPETWITAIQAMYLVGQFDAGKSILWHAGASSVSIAGIQLSVAGGASAVYATARSDEKCTFAVKSLGATAAFNTSKTKWSEELKKATDGKGVDVIVDFIGADSFQGNLQAAAMDGTIVGLGFLSGSKLASDVDIGPFLGKRLRYQGSTLRSRDEAYQKVLRDRLVETALPHLVDGTFTAHVDRVFKLEDICEAHKVMESNKTMGKLIVRID